MKLEIKQKAISAVPGTAKEEGFVSKVQQMNPGDDFEYHGRGKNEMGELTLFISIPGGEKFELLPSDMTSAAILENQRQIMFLSGAQNKMTLVESSESEFVFAPAQCNECKEPILRWMEAEWGICDSCKEKCNHTFVKGVMHNDKGQLSQGEFCQVCGRSKEE
jgi:hypothetical protein